MVTLADVVWMPSLAVTTSVYLSSFSRSSGTVATMVPAWRKSGLVWISTIQSFGLLFNNIQTHSFKIQKQSLIFILWQLDVYIQVEVLKKKRNEKKKWNFQLILCPSRKNCSWTVKGTLVFWLFFLSFLHHITLQTNEMGITLHFRSIRGSVLSSKPCLFLHKPSIWHTMDWVWFNTQMFVICLVWLQQLCINVHAPLSPFLTGRMFVREPSWKYSANLVGS